jgi:type IV pilus assembly protein PilE
MSLPCSPLPKLRPATKRSICHAIQLRLHPHRSNDHGGDRRHLAAIAVPSYNEYVQRARITEATSNLADMRNKMEQYFQDNRTWTPGAEPLRRAPPERGAPADFPELHVHLPRPTANTYTVAPPAMPGTSMNGFTFTINQFNQRATTTVPAGWTARPNCWVLKRDGSC